MKNPHDDLQRLLKRQDFKDEKELQDFMNSLTGQKVPEIPWEQLTAEEKAKELVEQAYEEHYLEDVIEKIEEALRYDPECIPAYILKWQISEKPSVKMNWLKKAVAIGEKKFGGKFEKENKGHFWEIHETRPYMEALFSYSEELYVQGHLDEALAVAEKMLNLNPNDNQGVRDTYSVWLIAAGEVEKFEVLTEKYPRDFSVFHHYNKALLSLREYGDDEETQELMEEAVEFNPFVVGLLLSKGKYPEMPPMYNPRQESGAILYFHKAKDLWKSTYGANKFLKKFEQKAKELARERVT